jgi:hypothetical protein
MMTGVKQLRPKKPKPGAITLGISEPIPFDEQGKAVVHHIQGSWFPNLVGADQQRYYRFNGEQLVLDADTGYGRVRIVWGRRRTARLKGKGQGQYENCVLYCNNMAVRDVSFSGAWVERRPTGVRLPVTLEISGSDLLKFQQ